MITGAHFLLYSPARKPSHPANGESVAPAGQALLRSELYLMCDDLEEVLRTLDAQGIAHSEVTQERWGTKTTVRLPSGGEIGLYQPSHPTALGLAR
jgi:hypothetical protein